MNNRIEITKLPNDLMISKRVLETYGTCPFCGTKNLFENYSKARKELPESHEYVIYESDCWKGSMYKNSDNIYKRIVGFFKGGHNHFWEQYNFVCIKCGAKWNSPVFPEYMYKY